MSVLGMSIATMATFHAAGYSAALRAFEDNELNYLGFVLHKLLLLGLVFAVVKLHFGLLGFVAAHLASNLLLWNFYHIVVTRLYAHIPLRFDVALWKSLLFAALPMGGGTMLRQLALQLDILVLTWMTNLTTVGLFSGPYRISMALRVIPQTLSLPLFPLYSRTAHLSRERFTEAYRWSTKFFALISYPIAAFFLAWSKPILRIALGQKYLAAIPAMQLLGIGIIPFFLSTLFQYLFAALDQQKRFLASTCVGSTLRLLLLVALIPLLGLVGPAAAILCAETVVVTIWMVQLARLGFRAKLSDVIWRPLTAGVAMTLVVFASAALKWVYFPFSRHPFGFQLPLLRNLELIPHFSLLSYGVVGIAVLTTGLVLRRRSATYLALAAAILIALWVAAPCQIAFQQPALLGRLIADTQELPMIRGFAKTYLTPNYGPAEDYPKRFDIDTLWGRFLAADSFLGLGW